MIVSFRAKVTKEYLVVETRNLFIKIYILDTEEVSIITLCLNFSLQRTRV